MGLYSGGVHNGLMQGLTSLRVSHSPSSAEAVYQYCILGRRFVLVSTFYFDELKTSVYQTDKFGCYSVIVLFSLSFRQWDCVYERSRSAPALSTTRSLTNRSTAQVATMKVRSLPPNLSSTQRALGRRERSDNCDCSLTQ